jgi:hypothetical protein
MIHYCLKKQKLETQDQKLPDISRNSLDQLNQINDFAYFYLHTHKFFRK